jgi:nucleoside 2-deoxyribosyltransferase
VFISYARRNGFERARHLDRDLTANEVTTWRDQRQLNPDLDFTAELETAIEESGGVVCCVTPDVRRADSFVRREIGYAIAVGKPIVPLIFEDTIPPISIVNVTREDFTHTSWERALRRLLDRLARGEDHEQLESDPFSSYLSGLYRDIVATLRQLVFTEIDLRVDLKLAQIDAHIGTLSSVFARGGLARSMTESPELKLTIREAFARADDRLLLVGQAGGGKTVSMLAFARDAVARRLDDSSHALPMLAPLAAWPEDPAKEPEGRIFAWLASQIPTLSEGEIRSTILNGQALLMLDGLDELSKKYPLDLFLQQLPAEGPLLTKENMSL